MGTELPKAVVNEESRLPIFKRGRLRLSVSIPKKNIMGLWIIQSIRKELDIKYSLMTYVEWQVSAITLNRYRCKPR